MHETANLDDGYLGSGHQLARAIKKYGKENFQREILHQFETQAAMIAKEAELVTEEFVQRKDTYNIKTGGIGGFSHITGDVEQRRKDGYNRWLEANRDILSQRMQKAGAMSTTKFTSGSPGQLNALTAALTPESRAKQARSLSLSIRGENNPFYNHKKHINPQTLEETIYKIGDAPNGWIEKTLYIEQEYQRLDKTVWFNTNGKNKLVPYSKGLSNGWVRGQTKT